MTKFINLKTGEIKTAFSINIEGDNYFVKFAEKGKPYKYLKSNLQIIENSQQENINSFKNNSLPFIVYSVPKQCWKCGNEIELLTYITYKDNPTESITFPWDKKRLLETQDIKAHMFDGRNGKIEYYGVHVLGEIEKFNSLIMQKFPNRIQVKYSKQQNANYPMNICPNCGAHQGWFFLFEAVDQHIKQMKELKIVDS